MSSTIPNPLSFIDSDRRRSVRKPLVAESWICSPTSTNPEADRIDVTSMNLSRHGVAFEIDRALPEGTFYTMQIGLGSQKLITEIKIVSNRRREKGHFMIGADFC